MSEAKVDPASLELRAPPRPVTRLNRGMLAALVGGLSFAVLGATIWSLQAGKPRARVVQPESHNINRVTRAEGLDRLPAEYSKLSSAKTEIAQLGSPLRQ